MTDPFLELISLGLFAQLIAFFLGSWGIGFGWGIVVGYVRSVINISTN